MKHNGNSDPMDEKCLTSDNHAQLLSDSWITNETIAVLKQFNE